MRVRAENLQIERKRRNGKILLILAICKYIMKILFYLLRLSLLGISHTIVVFIVFPNVFSALVSSGVSGIACVCVNNTHKHIYILIFYSSFTWLCLYAIIGHYCHWHKWKFTRPQAAFVGVQMLFTCFLLYILEYVHYIYTCLLPNMWN